VGTEQTANVGQSLRCAATGSRTASKLPLLLLKGADGSMDNQKITKHSRATLCDPAVPRKSRRGALTSANRGKDIQFYGSPNSVAQLIGINGLKQAEGRHLRCGA
jgi:hypothetical protein